MDESKNEQQRNKIKMGEKRFSREPKVKGVDGLTWTEGCNSSRFG